MITPIHIEEALVSEGRRLRDLVDKIKEAALVEATAETEYKVKFAKERLIARALEGKVTEGMADDTATVSTADERLAYLTAQAVLLALREELRISIARIDALRTLSASVRNVT